MSGSSEKSSFFAYESSVHSISVLLRLNDQRKQGLLCDVTVQVEDQSFRAHRSLLAACSDYFLTRIVNQHDTDPVISLPEQVTVKGFVPLLQFVYTAKLLLSKDNVSEVSKCAELLGIHNIEASCFQFLKLKFVGNKVNQEFSGKKCCKPLSKKVDPDVFLDDPAGPKIDETVKESLENEQMQVPCSKLRKFEDHIETPPFSQESYVPQCPNVSFESEKFSLLCPKYKKCQQGIKEDCVQFPVCLPIFQRISAESAPQGKSYGNVSLQNAQGNADKVTITSKCEECPIKMEGCVIEEESEPTVRPVSQGVECSLEKADQSPFSSQSSVDTHGFIPVPFSCSYGQYNGLTISEVETSMPTPILNGSVLASADVQQECTGANPSPNFCHKFDSCTTEGSSGFTTGRSNVEREVAEHLAKGFWSDIYSTENACTENACRTQMSPAVTKELSDQIYQEKRSECPWLGITLTDSPERTFTNLNSVNCPFISTLATEGFSNSSDLSGSEYVPDQPQEECQFDCVGEESETDTEGDSESCSAREQEREVKLPFSARRIVSLSRNDFQSLLKVHKLTSEQLDYVHDIRRRSKNRIAAQRCRKRKLDCIQNLETEIEKLQYEKNSLLKERDHILSTLGDTKNNLTELCQQVCREAALSQEQIHILAKYSASECPLSFLVAEKEKNQFPESVHVGPSGVGFPDSLISLIPATEELPSLFEREKSGVTYNELQEFDAISGMGSESAERVEHSGQSGITDFCRQMTDKCTTDE